jgi:hypothetical protein
MNKLIIAIVVAIVLVAGWYFLKPAADMEQDNGAEAPKSLVVQLQTQNNSGVTGTATFTETAEGSKVVLNVTGSLLDVVQPAHVHLNNCANIGGVKYPLNFPINGYSETMLDASIEEILAGLPLSVNVHKSVAEASVYVACGDIVAP